MLFLACLLLLRSIFRNVNFLWFSSSTFPWISLIEMSLVHRSHARGSTVVLSSCAQSFFCFYFSLEIDHRSGYFGEKLEFQEVSRNLLPRFPKFREIFRSCNQNHFDETMTSTKSRKFAKVCCIIAKYVFKRSIQFFSATSC